MLDYTYMGERQPQRIVNARVAENTKILSASGRAGGFATAEKKRIQKEKDEASDEAVRIFEKEHLPEVPLEEDENAVIPLEKPDEE
jgi:hypothetical protein